MISSIIAHETFWLIVSFSMFYYVVNRFFVTPINLFRFDRVKNENNMLGRIETFQRDIYLCQEKSFNILNYEIPKLTDDYVMQSIKSIKSHNDLLLLRARKSAQEKVASAQEKMNQFFSEETAKFEAEHLQNFADIITERKF